MKNEMLNLEDEEQIKKIVGRVAVITYLDPTYHSRLDDKELRALDVMPPTTARGRVTKITKNIIVVAHEEVSDDTDGNWVTTIPPGCLVDLTVMVEETRYKK